MQHSTDRQDQSEEDDLWTIGRVCLWPNGCWLSEHFEWRVPIDDERMLSILRCYTRVPVESEPYSAAAYCRRGGRLRRSDATVPSGPGR
jgi:5,5'-dehydrodivanillate O-demethylase